MPFVRRRMLLPRRGGSSGFGRVEDMPGGDAGIRWAEGVERVIAVGEPSVVLSAVPGSQPVITAPAEPRRPADLAARTMIAGSAHNPQQVSRAGFGMWSRRRHGARDPMTAREMQTPPPSVPSLSFGVSWPRFNSPLALLTRPGGHVRGGAGHVPDPDGQ